MRNISFALTTEQIRNQTKTVTRRCGWEFLKPGELLQPVVKAQGLKKGEKVQKLGAPIRVEYVRKERLNAITKADCAREGFPTLSPEEFMAMFATHNDVPISEWVTRIEFSYTETLLHG